MAGSVVGSARYLSPEQAAGRPVTPAADIYSLGASLYELLSGRTPHQGDSMTELSKRRALPPPPIAELVPDVPEALATAIMTCLDDDPDRRPRSAAALALALDASDSEAATRVLAAAPVERTLVMEPPRAAPARARAASALGDLFTGERRVRAMALAIGLLIVLVLVIAIASGGGGGKPKPAASRPKPVSAVPDGATPADDAHNLAVWIRGHSR
jgi:serine/threonine-protein kinase